MMFLGDLSRRGLLGGAVASSLALPSKLTAAPDLRPEAGSHPLRFAIIGDNTAFARPGVFDQAMQQVSWSRPDLVVSVGDLIEGYHHDPAVIGAQWNAVEHSLGHLHCPFACCPGNHDINNPLTLEAWTKRRGPTYSSFRLRGARFILLSTEDPGISISPRAEALYNTMVELMRADPQRAMREMAAFVAQPEIATVKQETDVVNISDRQIDWLRGVLRDDPRPDWTFVVMHKPAWKYPAGRFADVQTMLAGRPHTVIAGHTHYFTHERIAGRDYINMATCGGIAQRPGPGNMDHVINVTLTPEGPIYANIRLAGLLDLNGLSGQPLAY